MTKDQFVKYVVVLLEMYQQDKQIYEATGGAFNMLELDNYNNLLSSYISMLCSLTSINEEEFYSWIEDKYDSFYLSDIYKFADSYIKYFHT